MSWRQVASSLTGRRASSGQSGNDTLPADIGVVVPTLNSGATLATTLQAVHAQLSVHVQLLVVDSGSDDGTNEICRRWNVPTMHVPPGNMYRAINAGLSSLKTSWVTYVNSDDWVYPDSFGRLIALGNATNADVAYGDCDFADAMGRYMFTVAVASAWQLLPLLRLGIMALAQPATIFRRRLFVDLDGFDETYRLSSDASFFTRALKAGARFARLAGPPVATFRVHQGQLTQIHATEVRSERDRIRGLAGPTRRTDYLALLQWRARNAANYSNRFLRARAMS